jgi:4-amino-4-deoxy-L-arabinose transferase-like glycosyltransferase
MMSRLWEGDLHRDEVLYAAVAKGIVASGDWLNLSIGDTPYWRKPPLMFWLAAGAYEAFGVSVFAAKLFSALFGVLSCLALYAVVRRLFDERIALIAALVLATTPRFVRTAATFRLDSAVTLFTLLSIYAWIRAVAEPRYRHFVAAGSAWGLAVMAKGAFGIIGPYVVLIYLAVERRLRLVSSRGAVVSVLVAAAVCLPWHLYEVAHWGPDFLQTYLRQEIYERMTGELWEGGRLPDSYASYLVDLVKDAWPWLAFMVAGVAYAAKRARQGDRSALFVLCWASGYLALLWVSQGRRARYLVQAYPPLAILAAIAVDRLLPGRWKPIVPRAAALVFAAVGVALALLPIPIHSEAARPLKEMRPIVELLSPDAGRPLSGFRTRGLQIRASSIFYLDRDLHERSLGELRRDPAGLVLTLRENVAKLERKGFAPLRLDGQYVLMRAASNAGFGRRREDARRRGGITAEP